MYVRALPLLLAHPSIFAMPLLAALVQVLIDQTSHFFTDAVGGMGSFIFPIVIQLVYGFAFALAVIQASNAWRGRRATFDEAWEEGRRKAGGIVIALIGFYFLIQIAGYVGALLGSVVIQLLLQLAAAFFLIYTIPAAAIGGLPGSMAISASVRVVRASVLGTAILAVAFILLYVVVPNLVVDRFALSLGVVGYPLVQAALRALILAYLAFPFAKQYDDVAFTRYW